MDFRLSEEQVCFRRECREFATSVIRPAAPAHDREESVPWQIIREARRRGLEGPRLLERMAADPEGQLGVIYAEEMHWGCAGIALAISGTGLAAAGLSAAGTPEQIAEWLPRMYGAGDDLKLGAYAVTEPQAGSDVRAIRTTARLDGEEWVLNGTKVFITNGGIADVHVLVATVDPELGHRGPASFVVPKGVPGLRQGKKESKLGIRASHTAEVLLEDCRIPADNVLGGIDKLNRKLERARAGHRSRAGDALATFEATRPFVGAAAVGIARAAYEWTLGYLADREVSGDPVLERLDRVFAGRRAPLAARQWAQQQLAEIAMEIDAARLLAQRGAWMAGAGVPLVGGEGSMAKLRGGDLAVSAAARCIDLVGPVAQSRDCPLEKWLRDAKVYQIFEGTAQIQRMVVSRLQLESLRETVARVDPGPSAASASSAPA